MGLSVPSDAHPSTVPASRAGLSAAEAARLRDEIGPNRIAEVPGPSELRRFLGNLTNLFALLLWGGAALALVGGLPQLTVAIVVVVIVNAVFAFVQERKAERATDALKRLLPRMATVRRDGVAVEVSADDVVPGDVLILSAGDRVSADADLITATALRIDVSVLTGESVPVEPAQSVNAGTYVVSGGAEARVTATGMQTEFGRIASLTQSTPTRASPLERELDRVTRFVVILSTGIGATFFVVAGFLGMGLVDRFVFAIGVMVANVPEGLLPTVTLSLAMATQRMANRQALVRHLSAVETLGEATVICTDKTGTLTRNEMTVQRIWTPTLGDLDVEGIGYQPHGRVLASGVPTDPRRLADLLRAGLLCNDSRLVPSQDGWTITGDPTEGALVVLAAKGGLHADHEAAICPRHHTIPFDATRKRMTTIHVVGARRVAFAKGAVEEVLARSAITPGQAASARAAAHAMESSALRVLAIARRELRDDVSAEAEVERDLELLGIVGMLDPPRPEVPDAVARCRAAGIRIVMVTGDSGLTGAAIATRIGLVDAAPRIVAGAELERMDDTTLVEALRADNVVFARITPEQKLRLARVLRASGDVVAMTGDGVNDAPALKEADIGVAMGRKGTDVAREAADMILLDDNFASVVAAVEEGRAVWDNLRRFTSYHFCSNVGELVPFLVWGVSLGAIPLPLTVMQVLAIDLGTDMIPAIALGTERPEPGTMTRPPRPRGERLLAWRVLARVYGWVGLWEAFGAMAGFFAGNWLGGWRPFESLPETGTTYVEATTMTQTGIVTGQVGASLAMRTERRSVFSIGLFSNRFLMIAIAVEMILAVALIYVPGLNTAFHQSPIGPWHWLVLLTFAPLVLAAEELRKAVFRRWVWSRDGSSGGAVRRRRRAERQ